MELLEDALEVCIDGAAAKVFDRHDQLAWGRLHLQAYHRSRRRVLRRVLEQIAQRLLDQGGIDADQRKRRRHLYDQTMRRQAFIQPVDRRAHDLADRRPIAIDPDCARIESRHLQQLGDPLRHLA